MKSNETEITIATLEHHVRILREACQKFVDKVDSGRAQSRDSYAVFKHVLSITDPDIAQKAGAK